jgi:hypothetical protein
MNIIIAGSRTIRNKDTITKCILMGFKQLKVNPYDATILCGMAQGVDLAGLSFGLYYGIPVKQYPAQWNTYGNKAGYLRNKQMIHDADALIAIWDGKSKGTEHTINLAKEKGIAIYVETIS